MKTIAIIPARGGSKRLQNKNLLPLGGIPLLAHSILFAKEHHEIIDAVYVSTDDETIKGVALEYGAIVINRPAHLSGDNEPTLSALQHALETIGDDVDTVILLQPTNPLREKNLLREAYQIFQFDYFNTLFTVTRNKDKLGRIIDAKFVPYNYTIGQRSQDLEPLYFENGLLYIIRARTIRSGHIVSDKAFPFIVNHPFGNVDIDTIEDFDYAEYLYLKYQENKK
jgi:N-acylneuraminate cytidylyltransferase